MFRFYTELAAWWPLISAPEDYEPEAREFVRVLRAACPDARTLLELGSGGGHNARYLREHFDVVLTDLSAEMLEQSRRINPGIEHIVADMRSMQLGRQFDVVFAHDAIMYMTTADDLLAAMQTAYAHTAPGGVALFVPDCVRETFEPGSFHGGEDAEDGRGARYLEWSPDIPADATSAPTHYVFVTRDADGSTQTVSETHVHGVFPIATWLELLGRAGFDGEVVIEQTDDDREPRRMFIGRRAP